MTQERPGAEHKRVRERLYSLCGRAGKGVSTARLKTPHPRVSYVRWHISVTGGDGHAPCDSCGCTWARRAHVHPERARARVCLPPGDRRMLGSNRERASVRVRADPDALGRGARCAAARARLPRASHHSLDARCDSPRDESQRGACGRMRPRARTPGGRARRAPEDVAVRAPEGPNLGRQGTLISRPYEVPL